MILLDYCNAFSGFLNDMQIIEKFLVDNNLESEAISLISSLAESKIDKQRKENDKIKEKVREMSICTYAAFYEPELANLLQVIQLRLSINEGDELAQAPKFMNSLREEVPKHRLNVLMNRGVLKFLHDNGIYFKDETHE